MDAQAEILRLRERIHDLAGDVQNGALHAARTDGKLDLIIAKLEDSAIQRERMEHGQQQIEQHLRELNGRTQKSEQRLVVLETRSEDAKATGAKWGALLGGILSAIIAGMAQAFGGSK